MGGLGGRGGELVTRIHVMRGFMSGGMPRHGKMNCGLLCAGSAAPGAKVPDLRVPTYLTLHWVGSYSRLKFIIHYVVHRQSDPPLLGLLRSFPNCNRLIIHGIGEKSPFCLDGTSSVSGHLESEARPEMGRLRIVSLLQILDTKLSYQRPYKALQGIAV